MRAAASALMSVVVAVSLHAGQARDQNRIVLSGAASLSGLVTEADGKTPVRRAHVTLSRAGVNDSRLVTTDERGRYLFDALPPGLYMVSVTKGAYLRTAAGAVRPGLAGQQIVVREGEAAVAPVVALWRGAVITGRIMDAAGQPAGRAEVVAVQVTIEGNQRRPKRYLVSRTTTNEHGDYRLFALPPATYLVTAWSSPEALVEAGGAELNWFLKPGTTPAPAPPRPFQYAPTLHPSASDAQDASPVLLKQAEERTGIDVVLRRVPLARISGKVLGPDGAPAAGVMVSSLNDPVLQWFPNYGGQGLSGGDGAFAITSVTPGSYALTARGSSGGTPVNVPFSEVQRMGLPPTLRDLWARASVTVNGVDIAGLTIQLQPTVAITGRLVAQVADGRPVDLSRARVELHPPAIDAPGPFGHRVTVAADRTFRIEGVVPGHYKIWASLPGQTDLVLRSAMVGGRDAIDVPFEVPAGTGTSDLAISFTDARTELRGRITHATGEAASHLHVLAFPQNRAHQVEGSRRFASMRTRADGSYAIDSLPPGDYFLCTLTELDPSMQYDTDFLDELAKASLRITLGEGEKRTQDLRVASPGGR